MKIEVFSASEIYSYNYDSDDARGYMLSNEVVNRSFSGIYQWNIIALPMKK